MKEDKNYCKNCGKEFIPCHKTSVFCSKSCATSWRNKEKIKNGTHNFLGIDHGENARKMVKEGTHPFLSGNMSSEALKRKSKGIKQARLKESSEHRHPWQNPKNFIENEYSRSFSSLSKRNLTEAYLYFADCEYPDAFKLGWTSDINMRENDNRTIKISNLSIVLKGDPEFIISLEKQIKINFFNEDFYTLYKSTEIFPLNLQTEILNFIKNFK